MNPLKYLARKIPPVQRLHRDLNILRDERDALIARLRECDAELNALRASNSPFAHYNATFDPQETVRRHAMPNLAPHPEYLTNFLGVLIDPKFFPGILEGRSGQVEGLPIPANWHADVAEWGAALRAVDLARQNFTAIELGCGWACWLNNTGVAARRTGLNVRLIGVEGERGHVRFAEEALTANGFHASQWTVHHGIAGASSGIALFPVQDQSGTCWGLEPIFHAPEEQRREAVASGRFEALPIIALADLMRSLPRVDLLHMDIQASEAQIITETFDLLRGKVAYLVIGTHSRQIEGRLFEMLFGGGWKLEIERPAILNLTGSVSVTVDGVQGWRNPAVLT